MKLNIALARNNTANVDDLKTKLDQYGWPDEPGAVGVVDIYTRNNECIGGMLVIPKFQNINRIDKSSNEVITEVVTKHTTVPFHLYPINDDILIIETFSGSYKTTKQVYEFLSTDLGLYEMTYNDEQGDIDLTSIIDTCVDKFNNATLLSAYIDDYQPNINSKGTLKVSFSDLQTGKKMMSDDGLVKKVQVRITSENKKNIKITFCENFSFTYSCKDVDLLNTMNALRDIAGVPKRGYTTAFVVDQ